MSMKKYCANVTCLRCPGDLRKKHPSHTYQDNLRRSNTTILKNAPPCLLLCDIARLAVLQEEIDQKSVIRLTWRKLLEVCERVTDELHSVQGTYKKQLVKNVKVKSGSGSESTYEALKEAGRPQRQGRYILMSGRFSAQEIYILFLRWCPLCTCAAID